jgi:recombination associated protein RdgC
VKQKPTDVFTRWLTHRQLPDGLAFGAECDFLDIEEAAKVTCRNQDLETQEVRNHLESGKVCTMVGLIANGLRFSIDRQLTLRRLKLMDVIERPDDEADDPRSKLDYEIWETRTQLCQAIQALVPALGGFASEN